jgi:hypothetical protein
MFHGKLKIPKTKKQVKQAKKTKKDYENRAVKQAETLHCGNRWGMLQIFDFRQDIRIRLESVANGSQCVTHRIHYTLCATNQPNE